jgi:hypothetical protein
MLNAVYGAVKAVAKSNFVVSAGTAPYGDLGQGGRRIPPVDFMRGVLCLTRDLHRAAGCSNPAHLDAISHHPYAIAGPGRHALNSGDAAIPDIGKLTRLVRAAQRAKTVLPRGKKRVWVTEVSWDSKPPDPYGVREATHARWLAETFESLWRQGVDTITWFQVRDQPPVPDFGSTYQSGVLFADGRPKLAAAAFRFPFVARRSHGRVSYWLRAPAGGAVIIQTKVGGTWRTSVTRSARPGQVIAGNTSAIRGNLVRAAAGSQHSLDWHL